MSIIKDQLANIRLQLLDLGLRGNTLLHFAPRSRAVHVIDEKSIKIYDILVNKTKKMSFLPKPKLYEKDGEAKAQCDVLLNCDSINPEELHEIEKLPPLEEYLEETKGDSRHEDLYLQTNMESNKLDVSLIRIENEARTILQETGIDALYLSLGFVKWFESDSSNKERYSPLVLLPVELNRASAKSTYKLSYTGLDLSPNETLYAKMKNDFKIVMPEWPDEFDIQTYFNDIKNRILQQNRWEVQEDKIALGFFSFGKFQMYKDLDLEIWPEEQRPDAHSIICSLFKEGFVTDGELLKGLKSSEALKNPELLNLVKDCDSSQTEAIVAINRGANLVIQGPPGTGKSQTITNIISESLSKGKSILFVSQKMAALEVVKHRLDECHLGDAVLELHSHKSRPKQVLESLRTAIYQDKPSVPSRKGDYALLNDFKSKLNQYVEGISTTIKRSGANYIDALGKFMYHRNRWRSSGEPDFNTESMLAWDEKRFSQVDMLLEMLENHLKDMGLPKDHLFFDSGLIDLSPVEQEKISMQFSHSIELITKLSLSINKLASEMNFPVPEKVIDIKTVLKAARRATSAPPLKGIELNKQEWVEKYEDIKSILEKGKMSAEIYKELSGEFLVPFFEMDPLPLRLNLVNVVDKWWRFILPSYRNAKSILASVHKSTLPKDAKKYLYFVEQLIHYQVNIKSVKDFEPLLEQLYGIQWQGMKSDWEVLLILCEWIVDLHDKINSGDLPLSLKQFLSGGDQFLFLEPYLNESEKLLAECEKAFVGIVEKLDLKKSSTFRNINDQTLGGLLKLIQNWNANITDLYSLTRLNRICQDFKDIQEDQIADRILSWTHPIEEFPHFVKMQYWEGMVNNAYNECETLKRFDRVAHENTIKNYSKSDKSCFVYAQENLVSTLYDNLPNRNAPGEMEIIRRELNKKRRNLPVRKLIDQAGRVIQKVKPIFMMSPMSIASFLPPGKLHFDLIIFDEASQLTIPDSIGAIVRGQQIIVVGDSKQMPPSSFFSKSIEFDDEEAEKDLTADIESILSLFIAQGCPEKMLKWHYRSKHDALIATSNREFYDSNLKVFPNPGINPNASGLHFHYLPETIYDRGGSRSNKLEAEFIAQAVMEHANDKPKLSLGVVAFSMAQMEAILFEIEILRRNNPSVESYFKEHEGGESFFVKNLENVQGDERDVIMISIGYGRTKSGRMTTSFGPVNREGGERRLNVLISRAKMAMHVFSNFTSDDLAVKSDSPRGVQVLKAFLHFAEKGETELPRETGKQMESPFEEEVYRATNTLGYDIDTQVGSQGFFIDLAVRHPDYPGRYILAVECDGASYHSSANARDRDRLRQSVLESIGWRIHRIWSTDWFRNPEAEVKRLQEKIELCLKEESTNRLKKQMPIIEPSIQREKVDHSESAIEVYQQADLDSLSLVEYEQFHHIPEDLLCDAIAKVIEVESPVHVQVLTTRILNAMGLTRAGGKIRSRMKSILGRLNKAEKLVLIKDFAHAKNDQKVIVRNRLNCAPGEKKIELIAPIEIQQGFLNILKISHSIDRSNCISEVGNLLGFSRITSQIEKALNNELNFLINDNILSLKGDLLRLHA